VLKTPIHIYVSRASRTAVHAIENAGGTVTTRYYTPFAFEKILAGQMHPIHSRQFHATAISKLATPSDTKFQFALPDPTRRKYIEYYRDISVRGYLNYQIAPGQTPNLYFRMPGMGPKDVKKQKKEEKEDLLW
jgi:hypothetical protein